MTPIQRLLPFGPAVDIEPHVEGFFAGQASALGAVYAHAHGLLCNVALKAGAECETDAEDAASDAILYVQGWQKRSPDTLSGAAFLGMLTWATKIMVYRQKDQYKKYQTFSTQEPEGDDLEYVDDLEGFEERRIAQGGDTHEYLTSIETDTPEDIILRGNLRQFMESKAIEACGQRHWDIYHAVVVDERSQRDVGEQYDLSQQRVAQVVQETAVALKAALMGT